MHVNHAEAEVGGKFFFHVLVLRIIRIREKIIEYFMKFLIWGLFRSVKEKYIVCNFRNLTVQKFLQTPKIARKITDNDPKLTKTTL